jgi:hypothetical protein
MVLHKSRPINPRLSDIVSDSEERMTTKHTKYTKERTNQERSRISEWANKELVSLFAHSVWFSEVLDFLTEN